MRTNSALQPTQQGKDALFRKGLRYFEVDDWQGALQVFGELDELIDADEPLGNLYISYYGVVRMHLRDEAGLMLCRQAAAYEDQLAEVFYNLAVAESLMKYRRQAYRAMERGLEMDPQHRGLQRLQQRLGARRNPVIPFLSRDNLLNRWLGRLTYQSPYSAGVLSHAG